MDEKTARNIFLLIIAIEIILALAFYIFGDSCASSCGKFNSFLDPFGPYEEGKGNCLLICVARPNYWFYPTADLLIITVIIFFLWNILKKQKK